MSKTIRAVLLAVAVVAVVLLLLLPRVPGWFLPPALPVGEPLVIAAKGRAGPVDVLYDKHGMPHIFGETDRDLAYALGFVHARDRAFQMDMLRHAALGRLTELFGEDLLETDQRLRMLTHGLPQQMKRLSPRDRELLESYCAGVNSGAEHAGRSLEMRILGVDFEPFRPSHVVALARLQSWGLAHDLRSELFRAQVQDAIGQEDPRMVALMGAIPSGGVPIVSRNAHSGLEFSSLQAMRTEVGEPKTETEAAEPAEPPEQNPEHGSLLLQPLRKALAYAVKPFFDAVAGGGLGASNSWVVSGAHTKSGVPMLSNDPHLKHRLPSVFYLTHIEHPDFTAAGISFPGIPAILIGHTRHFAWGMTTSNIDGQDLVRLEVTENGEGYIVDGKIEPFETIDHTFRFGKGSDAEVVTEIWKVSRFGPVLSAGYEDHHPTYNRFALKWVGYESSISVSMFSAFWDFYRATTIDQVHTHVDKMSISGQNMSLAFTDGTIAYRLASAIAVRANNESTHLPRDGRKGDAGWVGFLSADYKPQLTNPQAGYLITANQRVVDDDWPAMRFAGAFGSMYYRAKRIDERIQVQIGKKPFTPEDFLEIQMDHTSIEARVVGPIIGEACPDRLEGRPDALVTTFCREIRDFDGVYSLDSTGALPYTLLYMALRHEVLVPMLGEDEAKRSFDQHAMRAAVEAALVEEAAGRSSPLFADDGLESYVARAADRALGRILDMAGSSASSWRWGDHHTLAPAHPLEAAPVIGGLFAVEAQPVSGWRETIHAEHGLPGEHGSALRFVVELTNPPRSRIVIDAGNSGHSGSPHYSDQREAWNKAEPFALELNREVLEDHAKGKLQLVPAQ